MRQRMSPNTQTINHESTTDDSFLTIYIQIDDKRTADFHAITKPEHFRTWVPPNLLSSDFAKKIAMNSQIQPCTDIQLSSPVTTKLNL